MEDQHRELRRRGRQGSRAKRLLWIRESHASERRETISGPDLCYTLHPTHTRTHSSHRFSARPPQSNSTAHLYPPQTTLLSVSPLSLSSFSHIALSVAPPSPFAPTLITLDPSLSPRLPFPLKRGMISTLARTGVGFELVLRGVTRLDQPGEQPGEAGKRRRNWIAGAREVVRATEGKGVVISSGAVRAGEMRGTEDLINLCVSFAQK